MPQPEGGGPSVESMVRDGFESFTSSISNFAARALPKPRSEIPENEIEMPPIVGLPTISYLGEVVQRLTRVELWCGWYGFEAANLPFVTVGIHIIMPIIVNNLAIINSLKQDDTFSQIGEFPEACSELNKINCTRCVPGQGEMLIRPDGTSVNLVTEVNMATGLSIAAGDFASFCISMGAVMQVLLALSFGPLADHGSWRQRLMMGTSVLSGIIAACFVFVGENSELYWLGGTLLALSSGIQGFGRIAYDSYLPILTDCSPKVDQALQDGDRKHLDLRESTQQDYSNRAISIGYVVSAVVVGVSRLWFPTNDYRVDKVIGGHILIFIGLWLAVGGAVSSRLLDPRPGASLPEGAQPIIYSWSTIISMFRNVKEYSQAFLFLVFRCLFADGSTTVHALPMLFVKQFFCAGVHSTLIFFLVVNLSAAVGPPIFFFLSYFTGIHTKYMLMGNVFLFVAVLFWIFMYWLMTTDPVNTLSTEAAPVAFMILALWGVILGSAQAYTRSVFLDMVPRMNEARFFTLYSLANLVSAAIGFTTVAAIFQAGDSTAIFLVGIGYIMCLTTCAALYLGLTLDYTKGMVQSGRRPS